MVSELMRSLRGLAIPNRVVDGVGSSVRFESSLVYNDV